MKYAILTPLVCFFFFNSCKKKDVDPECDFPQYDMPIEEPIEIPIDQSADYFIFKTGSYWVYHHYKVSNDGTEELQKEIIDSVYISDSQISEASSYSVYQSLRTAASPNETELATVQENVILNDKGEAIFSIQDINDTIAIVKEEVGGDPEGIVRFTIMKKPTKTSEVPAGNFEVIDAQTHSALNFDARYKNTVIVSHKKYANQVGLVLASYQYTSQIGKSYYERRLVRYHIE